MLQSYPDYIQVLVAILISILSGLLGIFIQRYLSRSKPSISVTGLGFTGKTVHLDEETIEATRKDVWDSTLADFVSFETVSDREKKTTERILELEKTKTVVDEWLIQNSSVPLNKNLLLSCPFFRFHRIGNAIDGELARRSLPELPVDLKSIEELPSILDLDKHKDDGWILHLGATGLRLPYLENFSDKEKLQQDLIAMSFSKGIKENIFFLLKHYSQDCAGIIHGLIKLRERLRASLEKHAKLYVVVELYNIGSNPVIFSPYMISNIYLGDESKKVLMKVSDNKESENNQNMKDTGSKFNVNPHLSKQSGASYISVNGGGAKRVELESIAPLDEFGAKAVGYFELGGIECDVSSKTIEGKFINSQKSTFGRKMSEAKKAQFLSQQS